MWLTLAEDRAPATGLNKGRDRKRLGAGAVMGGIAQVDGHRDERIDFLRGVALIFIFVDHVPESLLSLLTLQSYAFADAAELFYFLSGYVAAMVYGRTVETRGALVATWQIWRRAWVLYIAQILLFVFLAAEVSLAVAGTGHASYHDDFRLGVFLAHPDTAIVHALLLRYQPVYLDILPVYVLLLLAFPIVLFGLARNFWLVLVPSTALYIAVQVWAFTLHTFPNGEGWFFNPLAWQFLFVLGATLGHPRLKGRWTFLGNPRLLKGAMIFAGLAAALQIPEALRMIWPHIPSLTPVPLPLDKSVLEPLRIASFLALAIVARRYVPAGAILARTALGRAVIRCGQHSLHIFCLGVLLSAAGAIIAEETGHSFLVQFCISLAGIVILLAFARYLDGLRQGRFRLLNGLAPRGSQPA